VSSSNEEALLALAAKGQVERNLASLSLCPPLRHAAFAATVAALVTLPVVPLPFRLAAIPFVFMSIFLIVRWDKRRLGVFIKGYRRGKTRIITFLMLVLVLGSSSASDYFLSSHEIPAVSLALAAITFLIGYLGSLLWQRVFVSELDAG
jgi:hypothetical protein